MLNSEHDLVHNVRKEAYDLCKQSCEQNCQEHDERHANDSTEAGQNVLTDRVVVDHHHGNENQQTEPDISNRDKKVDDCHLGVGYYVGRDGCGDNKQRNGSQAVAKGDKDILETTLTVKQRCQTPVACRPKEEGGEDRCELNEDRGIFTLRIEYIALTDSLVVERQNCYKNNDYSCSYRTSLFVLEVPEAVEGVKNYVKRI